MFKRSLIAVSLLFSASAMAFELSESARVATDAVSEHYGEDSVVAYKVEKEDHENLVTVKTHSNGNLFFGCHYHGQDMACHFEGDDYKSDEHEVVELSVLRAGEVAALKSFSRRLDINSIFSYKVWASVGHAHKDDHHDEVQVWVRYDYMVNDSERAAFYMCHGHAGSTELFCHRETSAHDEPQF